MSIITVSSPVIPFAENARDTFALIQRLRKYYTGRYEVYRVMDPDLISGIMGVYFTLFEPVVYETEGESVEFSNVKIYVINDIVKNNTINFYIQCGVYRHTIITQQNMPSMASRYTIQHTIHRISIKRPVSTKESRHWCTSTPLIDFVLDYYCQGVFTKEMFRNCKMGNIGRELYLDYQKTEMVKQYLTVDCVERLP